jgi:hypothetical protein
MNWQDYYPPSQIDEEEETEEFNDEFLAADDKIKAMQEEKDTETDKLKDMAKFNETKGAVEESQTWKLRDQLQIKCTFEEAVYFFMEGQIYQTLKLKNKS